MVIFFISVWLVWFKTGIFGDVVEGSWCNFPIAIDWVLTVNLPTYFNISTVPPAKISTLPQTVTQLCIFFSKLLPFGHVLPIWTADWAPLNPDICSKHTGGDVVLVQLLDWSRCNSRPCHPNCHIHVNTCDHVHRPQVWYPTSGICEGKNV